MFVVHGLQSTCWAGAQARVGACREAWTAVCMRMDMPTEELEDLLSGRPPPSPPPPRARLHPLTQPAASAGPDAAAGVARARRARTGRRLGRRRRSTCPARCCMRARTRSCCWRRAAARARAATSRSPRTPREHGQPFHVMRRASRRRSRSLRCQSPRTPATCARASCSAVRTAAERLLASGLPPLAEVAAPQPPAHQCGAACIGHRHAWAVSRPGCRRPPRVAACTFQSALANIATLDRHAVSCSRSTSTSKFTCRLTHRH
jgi:hypothetical protein